MSDEYPDDEPVVADLELDARAIRAWVELADPAEDDSAKVLVITDGDTTVRIAAGLAGHGDLAVYGMQRLAAGATQYATALRFDAIRGAQVYGPLNGP